MCMNEAITRFCGRIMRRLRRLNSRHWAVTADSQLIDFPSTSQFVSYQRPGGRHPGRVHLRPPTPPQRSERFHRGAARAFRKFSATTSWWACFQMPLAVEMVESLSHFALSGGWIEREKERCKQTWCTHRNRNCTNRPLKNGVSLIVLPLVQKLADKIKLKIFLSNKNLSFFRDSKFLGSVVL